MITGLNENILSKKIIMIPEKKAISIIENMSFSINKQIDFNTGNLTGISQNPFAKQCALIAVDLAIEAATSFLSQEVAFEKSKEYWYNVKTEIEKL